MQKFLFLLLAITTVFASCKNTGEATTEATSDGIHFGEVIDTVGVIAYTDLLSQVATQDTVEAKVVAKVSTVCQAKGCWMNVVSDADSTKTEMVVDFKDYGFFVPKDLGGKEVVMLGKAYKEMTPVDELKHLAEDEGLAAEEIAKITEPKMQLKFTATGVMIK